MQAGLDAGGQSAGLELIRRLDPDGARTVGVLTKVDLLAEPGVVRSHIQDTLRALPLRNGYFAVMLCALNSLCTIQTVMDISRNSVVYNFRRFACYLCVVSFSCRTLFAYESMSMLYT